MKNSIILLAIAAFLFAGCDNTQTNEHSHDGEGVHDHTEGTHVHEDGTVHQDHQPDDHTQEEFKVEGDSTSINTEEHGHSH